MAFIDEEGRRVKEKMPLEGLRAAITESMTRSKRDFPQGTGSAELDITKLIEFRKEVNEKLKESGKKVTFGDLYVKVAACAMEENMDLNGARLGNELVYYDDINIGVAASINGVLINPVIEHADQKNIEEISEELSKAYGYLKKGKLMRVKLEGATFTVSNLGTYLIDDQHPFLVPPQACIFGISRNRVLPVYNENMEIVPGNMTLFSLTIDHGFTDGVNVAKFLTSVNKVLQDPWTYMYHKAEPKTDEAETAE